MASRIRNEIKQTKPFQGLEQEVFVALQKTADQLMQELAVLLKARGLSPTQYNVLRILRGAGQDGLPCGEVANRMITRDPDMTRLLDRMEAHSLVKRAREQKDRRVITTRITAEGLSVTGELDPVVEEMGVRQFSGLTRKEMRMLLELLDKVRVEGA